jgi:hypothetical protein
MNCGMVEISYPSCSPALVLPVLCSLKRKPSSKEEISGHQGHQKNVTAGLNAVLVVGFYNFHSAFSNFFLIFHVCLFLWDQSQNFIF